MTERLKVSLMRHCVFSREEGTRSSLTVAIFQVDAPEVIRSTFHFESSGTLKSTPKITVLAFLRLLFVCLFYS